MPETGKISRPIFWATRDRCQSLWTVSSDCTPLEAVSATSSSHGFVGVSRVSRRGVSRVSRIRIADVSRYFTSRSHHCQLSFARNSGGKYMGKIGTTHGEGALCRQERLVGEITLGLRSTG